MMKTINTLRRVGRLGSLTCLGLIGLSLAPHANADSILMAQTSMVTGATSVTDSFEAPGAGAITISLANIPWPEPLSSLSIEASSASAMLSAWSVATSASQTFDVSGAGTYFAHITSQAAGALDIGLYSMLVTFAPSAVPLPASAWLLVAGLLGLGGFTWARGFAGPLRYTGRATVAVA